MKRTIVRALEVALVPTIAFVVVVLALPDRRELALHVWLLAVLAVVLVAALRAIRVAHPPAPSRFDAPGARHEDAPAGFASLARLEREVSMATASAFDVHVRLRPTLRIVAAGLLLVRRGIDLDRSPARARAALGDETWDLVRGDRRPPEDGRAPGVDLIALDRVVSSLERL
jgi:hypothetical protein